MGATVKLCKDCRWLGKGILYDSCLNPSVPGNPEITRGSRFLVDGGEDEPVFQFASTARLTSNLCGRQARYFEEKIIQPKQWWEVWK